METPRTDLRVFVSSLAVLFSVTAPLMIWPDRSGRILDAAYAFITDRLGVVYLWAGLATLILVLWLALGRYGQVKLGAPDVGPRFSLFSWIAMLFCAGIGTGILYWGTIEWAYYFEAPPHGLVSGSPEAIEWATSYPLFHWGITGWAFYCLPAVAIAHTYFTRGVPSLRLSESCRPVIGTMADGPLGKLIDVIFMIGLIGAAGTGIGLAVPLISVGLSSLTGVPDSFALNIVVVAAVTALMGGSVYFGLDRGIRRLSNLNVALTFVFLAFVLVVGPTLFIVKTGTNSLGHLVQNFVRMNTWMDP